MLKLFYMFLTKRLLGSYKKETIFNHKLLILNSLKFKLSQRVGLTFFSLIIFLSITQYSCDTTEPPIIIPPPPVVKDTITVSVESFTHRSVTLNVKCTINNVQSTIRLFRKLNGISATVTEYSILVKDTTITDDDNGAGLLLDTTYTYFSVRVDSLGQLKDTSNIVTQKTLAPTSHNYTWQEFTIGDWQSALYDVWGTDENNVWAVGTVLINDTAYGVIKWNGVEWKGDKKIGGVSAIYGFSNNEVWAVGGAVEKWDGVKWNRIDATVTNGNVTIKDSILFYNNPDTSIWGISSSNLYLGNAWGKIIHWDGTKASVVYENLNNIPITDIYGLSDNFVLATGGSSTPPSITVKYQNNNWSEVSGLANFKLYYTSFPISSNEYYVAGENIMRYCNSSWIRVVADTISVINRIRGNISTGEIVAVGHNSTILHFNGLDWHRFNVPAIGFDPLQSVYLTNNKIFVVGIQDSQAKIIIGTKIK